MNGTYLFHTALQFGQLESARLLLDADCALYPSPYPGPGPISLAISLQDEDLVVRTIEGIIYRRVWLYEMAQILLPAKTMRKFTLPDDRILDSKAASVLHELGDYGVTVPPALYVPFGYTTIYDEEPCLNRRVADLLWESGFRDTPLPSEYLQRSCTVSSYDGHMQMATALEMAQWFRQHGCEDYNRMSWVDTVPKLYTQLLSGILGDCRMPGYPEDQWKLHRESVGDYNGPSEDRFTLLRKSLNDYSGTYLRDLLLAPGHDECLCACSVGGCTVMAWAFASALRWSYYPSSASHRVSFVKLVEDLCSSQSAQWNTMKSQIIRSMTFIRLGLTHTCCGIEQTAYYRHAPESMGKVEACEIREEQRLMIHDLDNLSKEFETLLGDETPLSEFLEGPWEQRMEEYEEEGGMQEGSEEDRRAVEEIGVVLWD